MKLDRLIELFAGQDGDKHDLEVSLADLREWHAEIERLRGEKSYLEDEVIPALRAEIERLQAGLREYACTGTDHPCGCYNQFLSEKAEIERLRVIKCNLVDEGKLLVCKAHAEIERQQAALTYIRDDSTDLDDAKTVARFALELRVL